MERLLPVVVAGTPNDIDRLLAALSGAGLAAQPRPAASAEALAAAIAAGQAELVLLASQPPAPPLPGLSVAEVVALCRGRTPPPSIIVLANSLEAAHAALEAGAQEVVVAPPAADLPTHLALAVARARRQAASQAHYQGLFIGSRRARLLLDPATGLIVEANPAAAALYGRPVSELAGLPFAALCLWPAEQVQAQLAQAGDPDGYAFAGRQAVAGGQPRDVETHGSPVQVDGRALLELAVRDLGERVQREHEWDALGRLGAALRVAATRADLLSVVVQQVLALLPAEAAAVALRDPFSGEAVIEHAQGWPEPAGARGGLASRVLDTGQAQTVSLPSEAAAALGLRLAGAWQTALAVPLAAQGQTIGALCVGTAGPLGAARERLLAALADTAAGAIQRTTLHEKVEQRLQRLAALHAIDVAIASSFDLRVTLNIFLDHLVSQLGADAAAVLLLNEAAQTLHYAAVRGLSAGLMHRPAPRLTTSPPGRVVLQGASLFLPRLADERSPGTAHPPSGEVFASYYGVPLVARGRVQGVLEVFQRTPLRPDHDWVEYLNSLATQAAIAIDNATLFNELQRSNLELNLAYEATIESWARMLEARGIEQGGHTRRVADHVVALAQRSGLADSELLHLRRGALLHDIGMLGVPEAIVLKPTTYSRADFAVVQRHPLYAFEILAPIAYLRPALDIPYAHHERWDGSGYPRQLRGERIPLPARLFAVVDVWDALVTERPYRPAWPAEEARAYLREQAGQLFDPQAVSLLLQSEPSRSH